MRKLLIAVGLLLAAGSTKAQENRGFEVSGSYQFVRFNPGGGSDGINCHGGSGSVGADVTLTRHVSFRAIQVEYLYTHFGGASQNNLRLQSGIVWRIGR